MQTPPRRSSPRPPPAPLRRSRCPRVLPAGRRRDGGDALAVGAAPPRRWRCLRLGHLRRRRFDARPHAMGGYPARSSRETAHRRTAPDLRRRIAREDDARGGAAVLGRGHPPHRRAARRRAGGRGTLRAAPGWLCLRRRPRRRPAPHRRFRHFRRSLPGEGTRRRRPRRRTSTTSSARSTPARRGRSPSSSTPTTAQRFRDRCVAAGIRVSIVPGILPITRFLHAGRAALPGWRGLRASTTIQTRRLIAANVAIEQVSQLRRHGVHEFHFYAELRRAELRSATRSACARPRRRRWREPRDRRAQRHPGASAVGRRGCDVGAPVHVHGPGCRHGLGCGLPGLATARLARWNIARRRRRSGVRAGAAPCVVAPDD